MIRAVLLAALWVPFAAHAGGEVGPPASVAVAPPSSATLIRDGDAAYDAARYETALALYQSAAALPELGNADALVLAHAIGRTQTKLRRLDDALVSFDRALALLGAATPPVQAFVGPVLRQARGEALRAKGEPAAARLDYQSAFDGYEALGKGALAARMQAEIGSTYVDQAEFAEALRRYAEARRRMEAAASPELGRLLVNTGSLLTWLGKFDDAVALEPATVQACETPRRDPTCLADAAHVQGFTRYQLGDYAGAATASRRAAELFDATQPVERARALNNLGLAELGLQQPEAALASLQQSWALLQAAGAGPKDRAAVLDSLGTARLQAHDVDGAGALYRQALVDWQLAGHREGRRDTLAHLGQLAVDLKQPETAIFWLKLSVNEAQALRADARSLAAGYLDAITRRLAPSYQTLAGLLVDQGRLPEALQVLRMLKEQELFDFLNRSGAAGDTTAAFDGVEAGQRAGLETLQQRLFALAREREALDARPAASLTPAERERKAAIEAQLQAADGELDRFLGGLQQALAAANRPTEAVDDGRLRSLQTVLETLGQGAVLLHYVALPDHLDIVLTASPSQAIRGYRVPVTQQTLNQAVFAFREQIERIDPAAAATARQLHDWLMPAELRRDLADAGARILMVSLTDSLRYLPFTALHDETGWLAERYAVALYTDAVAPRLGNAPRPAWSVRAFGMTQAADGFPALAWVRREIDGIVGAERLPGHADLDADFTLDRLHDAVQIDRPPVVHIASHFVFRPGTEDDSFLLLGVGRLNLATLRQWTFHQLDLLTLSACETAVGGGLNRNGREVEGFAALAQQRGADAVIASLWPVADPSTAAFMRAFYEGRRADATITKVEAMRRVQIAMIQRRITPATPGAAAGTRGELEGAPPVAAGADWSHPHFWAPFVLVGNWR